MILDQPWESVISTNNQWQYKPTNKFIKDGNKQIKMLIETRAKGGNLLLNLSLKPNGEFDIAEQEPLHELAAWVFVNQESLYDVRPWIVSNEGDIWFTKAIDEPTVYVHLTGHESWERGKRKNYILKSLKITKDTKIEVLGHDGLVVEYQPSNDPKSYAVQKEDGILLSVIRAQRIYNNNFWPNPVVVKLTNVKPAYEPPTFETLDAEIHQDRVYFKGRTLDLKGFDEVLVCFEYRIYPGFHESIYYDTWKKTDWLAINKTKKFRIKTAKLLEKNTEYEFRVVLKTEFGSIKGNVKEVEFPDHHSNEPQGE